MAPIANESMPERLKKPYHIPQILKRLFLFL